MTMSTSNDLRSPPQPLLADSPLYVDHFEALRADRLTVRKCNECGTLQWPPRDMCGTCQSTSFALTDVPRSGQVYTYTVMYRAFQAWFTDKLPYGVVVVELIPGVRMMGRYIGDPETLTCGQHVDLEIQQQEGGIPIACWKSRTGRF